MKRIMSFLLSTALLAGCAAGTSAPLIGISCGRSDSGMDRLSETYPNAVLAGGGLPVIFPTVQDEETARDLIARVDGILFSGGPDFDPALYGEEIWNETVSIDAVRDKSDLLLAKAALESGKPILAICRGEQLMNVALGGSLIQDIPTQVPDSLVHAGGALHRIAVEKGSALYRIFGKDSLTVNSYHHQAVKRPGEGITITARADDGVVEAFEKGPVLAVQFHPEKSVETEPEWTLLFKDLADRARKDRGRK